MAKKGGKTFTLVSWQYPQTNFLQRCFEIAAPASAVADRALQPNRATERRILRADLPKLGITVKTRHYSAKNGGFHDRPRCDTWSEAVEFPIRIRSQDGRRDPGQAASAGLPTRVAYREQDSAATNCWNLIRKPLAALSGCPSLIRAISFSTSKATRWKKAASSTY